MTKTLSIVILNWNNAQLTSQCIDSLYQSSWKNFSIIIVDNGSSDDSEVQLRQKYPDIQLIQSGANLGYAGGNNIGIQAAIDNGADYILVINNDVEVDGEFLAHMMTEIGQDQDHLWGPVSYFYSHQQTIQSAGMKVGAFGLRVWQKTTLESTRPYPVPLLNGVAILCHVNVYRTAGLLDSTYFLYAEEVEFCLRAAKNGIKCQVVPTAKIWHKISPQQRQSSALVTFHMFRGKILTLRRHGGLSDQMGVVLIGCKESMLAIRQGNTKIIASIWQGMVSGITSPLQNIPFPSQKGL